MIILLVVLIAIVVALMRGGHLSNFAHVQLRFFYLLFVPLLLQLIVFSPLGSRLPEQMTTAPLVYISSMLIGAIVVLANLTLPGFRVLLLGLCSNLFVILVNGGYMPTSMAARLVAGLPTFDGVHNNSIPLISNTPLWFLGDIVPIPQGVPFASVFSIGDVLIAIGGVLFIQSVLLATVPQQKKGEPQSGSPSTDPTR